MSGKTRLARGSAGVSGIRRQGTGGGVPDASGCCLVRGRKEIKMADIFGLRSYAAAMQRCKEKAMDEQSVEIETRAEYRKAIVRTAVLEAGFTVPASAVYRKPDPRGPEYGYFEVDVTGDSHRIGPISVDVVKRRLGGRWHWECQFKELKAFTAWAKENT